MLRDRPSVVEDRSTRFQARPLALTANSDVRAPDQRQWARGAITPCSPLAQAKRAAGASMIMLARTGLGGGQQGDLPPAGTMAPCGERRRAEYRRGAEGAPW